MGSLSTHPKPIQATRPVLELRKHCRSSERIFFALRILGMSWGVKNTFIEAPGVSLGGSGVSIGGVKILRVK